MIERTPTVSIGMPVYNASNYVVGAISCHLEQTFEDFELVVCDNASTDETADIVAELAAKDPRVKLVRHSHNIGANRNYNAVLVRSTGEFFRWAAHDDLVLPTYLERCVELLRDDERVIVAHSRSTMIDGEGLPYEPFGRGLVSRDGIVQRFPEDPRFMEFVSSPKAHYRFRSVLFHYRTGGFYYGLGRRSAWKRTTLQRPFYGTDKVLLAELALQGPFAQVPEHLFLHRFHEAASTWMTGPKARAAWADPSALPRWHPLEMFREYGKVVRSADISEYERLMCAAYLIRKGLRSEEIARVFSPESAAHLSMVVRRSLNPLGS